jgi:hypothetical protein
MAPLNSSSVTPGVRIWRPHYPATSSSCELGLEQVRGNRMIPVLFWSGRVLVDTLHAKSEFSNHHTGFPTRSWPSHLTGVKWSAFPQLCMGN